MTRSLTTPTSTLLRDSERFFNDPWILDFFKDFDRTFKTSKVTNFPPCNISTNKEGTVKFEFALAGYDEKDLEITVEDDKLIITNEVEEESKDEKEKDDYRYLHHGIRSSSFKAVYPLGHKLDSAKASAQFKDGMLTITIPVAEERKPRSIKILTS